MRRFSLFLLSLCVLPLGACSGGNQAYCGILCDCAVCNQEESELCPIYMDASQKTAGVYGCEQYFSAMISCYSGEAVCNEADHRLELEEGLCDAETDDFQVCGAGASSGSFDLSLFPTPTGGNSVAACTEAQDVYNTAMETCYEDAGGSMTWTDADWGCSSYSTVSCTALVAYFECFSAAMDSVDCGADPPVYPDVSDCTFSGC